MFDPDSGGKKIPQSVRRRVEARLRRYAEDHFAGRHTRLEIRFRGQFCYVDAYTEPEPLTPGWPPADWPEPRGVSGEAAQHAHPPVPPAVLW